ncbi:hypothetical protein QN277_022429 [Acacia crassicarpa]|uniref:Uncharacterized protein n=1 Tax=Acacia crassicarpa TaxID=499986 RepID=A0AAE1MPL8_9FABA|nr:hypothetical protein QN277_022429 [Acacia crassicarpa]
MQVLIYDLCSSHPVQIKDHMYESAILDIKWHHTLNYERPKLITSYKHVVKIWDPESDKNDTVLIKGDLRDTKTIFPVLASMSKNPTSCLSTASKYFFLNMLT